MVLCSTSFISTANGEHHLKGSFQPNNQRNHKSFMKMKCVTNQSSSADIISVMREKEGFYTVYALADFKNANVV